MVSPRLLSTQRLYSVFQHVNFVLYDHVCFKHVSLANGEIIWSHMTWLSIQLTWSELWWLHLYSYASVVSCGLTHSSHNCKFPCFIFKPLAYSLILVYSLVQGSAMTCFGFFYFSLYVSLYCIFVCYYLRFK